MKKSTSFFVVTFLLILTGCDSTIEVRNNEVAVAVSDRPEFDGRVLKSGLHKVSYNSKVVYYDVSPDQIHFDIDYVTKDALSVKIKFSMTYESIPDSLASFYRRYESDSIHPVVASEVRSNIRNAVKEYARGDLTNEEIREKAIKAIHSNNDINKYIVIKDISQVEVK